MNLTPPRSRNSTLDAAFTLLELMVVMGIIIAMIALVAPAFTGMLKGRGLGRAASDISGMIDLSRTEAMSKGTYVWLGFNNAKVNGASQLWVVATRSLDGTPTLTQANTRMIGKVQKFDHILLTSQSELTAKTQSILGNASVSSGNAPAVSGPSATVSPGLPILVDGSSSTFTQFVVFTPQGQALVTRDPATAKPPTPFTAQMLIGLRKTTGVTPLSTDADSVALVLNGGTGAVNLFRP